MQNYPQKKLQFSWPTIFVAILFICIKFSSTHWNWHSWHIELNFKIIWKSRKQQQLQGCIKQANIKKKRLTITWTSHKYRHYYFILNGNWKNKKVFKEFLLKKQDQSKLTVKQGKTLSKQSKTLYQPSKPITRMHYNFFPISVM